MRYLLLGLALVAIPSSLHAQATFAKGTLVTDASVTNKSAPVAVRLVDPLSRVQDERTIRSLFQQPNRFEWIGGTPLSKIAEDLSQHVSFEIDIRALEEIGLKPDVTYGKAPPPKQRKLDSSDDPFANTPLAMSNSGNTNSTTANSRRQTAKTQKWWANSPRSRLAPTTQSVGSKLFFILDQLDLTLNYKSGQWMITSIEAAEERLQIRLYDVTPLVDDTQPRTRRDVPMGLGGFTSAPAKLHSGDALIDNLQVHIEPDTWEMLGGPSTISLVSANGRLSLVVSTRPTIHWKIEAFLNQLNGAK